MPSSTASYTLRTASRSTARPCASHRKNLASVAILTQTPPSEPLKPSMGGRCPRSPECCPRWIGITVRNQSESLSAIAGIRNKHQSGRIKHTLRLHPTPARPDHVCTLLLRRVQSLFFKADVAPIEEPPNRGAAARDSSFLRRRNDLVQRQVWLFGNQNQQEFCVIFQR